MPTNARKKDALFGAVVTPVAKKDSSPVEPNSPTLPVQPIIWAKVLQGRNVMRLFKRGNDDPIVVKFGIENVSSYSQAKLVTSDSELVWDEAVPLILPKGNSEKPSSQVLQIHMFGQPSSGDRYRVAQGAFVVMPFVQKTLETWVPVIDADSKPTSTCIRVHLQLEADPKEQVLSARYGTARQGVSTRVSPRRTSLVLSSDRRQRAREERDRVNYVEIDRRNSTGTSVNRSSSQPVDRQCHSARPTPTGTPPTKQQRSRSPKLVCIPSKTSPRSLHQSSPRANRPSKQTTATHNAAIEHGVPVPKLHLQKATTKITQVPSRLGEGASPSLTLQRPSPSLKPCSQSPSSDHSTPPSEPMKSKAQMPNAGPSPPVVQINPPTSARGNQPSPLATGTLTPKDSLAPPQTSPARATTPQKGSLLIPFADPPSPGVRVRRSSPPSIHPPTAFPRADVGSTPNSDDTQSSPRKNPALAPLESNSPGRPRSPTNGHATTNTSPRDTSTEQEGRIRAPLHDYLNKVQSRSNPEPPKDSDDPSQSSSSGQHTIEFSIEPCNPLDDPSPDGQSSMSSTQHTPQFGNRSLSPNPRHSSSMREPDDQHPPRRSSRDKSPPISHMGPGYNSPTRPFNVQRAPSPFQGRNSGPATYSGKGRPGSLSPARPPLAPNKGPVAPGSPGGPPAVGSFLEKPLPPGSPPGSFTRSNPLPTPSPHDRSAPGSPEKRNPYFFPQKTQIAENVEHLDNPNSPMSPFLDDAEEVKEVEIVKKDVCFFPSLACTLL